MGPRPLGPIGPIFLINIYFCLIYFFIYILPIVLPIELPMELPIVLPIVLSIVLRQQPGPGPGRLGFWLGLRCYLAWGGGGGTFSYL